MDQPSSHKKASLADINPALAPGEIILGQLKGLDAQGQALVDYDCNPDEQAQVAVSTLPVTQKHLGRQVALLFASGDLRRPVIMGFIHNPLDELLENFVEVDNAPIRDNPAHAKPTDNNTVSASNVLTVDGRQIVIDGKEEIVLRCGESSITLHKSGKITISGKYLLSRASGVNRILGGSVQVN